MVVRRLSRKFKIKRGGNIGKAAVRIRVFPSRECMETSSKQCKIRLRNRRQLPYIGLASTLLSSKFNNQRSIKYNNQRSIKYNSRFSRRHGMMC